MFYNVNYLKFVDSVVSGLDIFTDFLIVILVAEEEFYRYFKSKIWISISLFTSIIWFMYYS